MPISSEVIIAIVTVLTFLGGIITYMINSEVKLLKQSHKALKDEIAKNELAMQATIVELKLAQANADKRYHDDVKEIFEAIKSIGREINDFKISQTRELSSLEAGIKKDIGSLQLTLVSNYMSKEDCEKRVRDSL